MAFVPASRSHGVLRDRLSMDDYPLLLATTSYDILCVHGCWLKDARRAHVAIDCA